MDVFDNIIVTDVLSATTVHSPRGRFQKTVDRKTYGLSFCTDGQITYTHKGRDYISDNKHIIILPQDQTYTLKGDKTGDFAVINFTCSEPLCDTILSIPVHSTVAFMEDFDKIKELVLLPKNRTGIISIFYNIIYKFSFDNSISGTILPAIKFIEENYSDEGLTNTTLADICNISEVYLRKLFLKHLNTTPKQYISDIRLSKAKNLLSDGILKINAIAEQCGFSSSYNFSRFFKEKTGLTPTEYMKENKIVNL